MWITDELERLEELGRAYGFEVRYESGWRHHGASGGQDMTEVAGVLWHHTAGSRSGTYPSRRILHDGRPGLSGPLCHVGLDRDGVVRVHGDGKANHAGSGDLSFIPRNTGNTRLFGVEMESAGTRPWDWTSDQLRVMPRLGAALNELFSLDSHDHQWGHKEYSSSGKIDPAGLPGDMDGFRDRIASADKGGGQPWEHSNRVDGFSEAEVREIQIRIALTEGEGVLGHWGADGSYGDATGTAVQGVQERHGLTTDGVYGPATSAAHQEDIMGIISDIWAAEITLDTGERVTMANAVRKAHAVSAENRETLTGPITLNDGEEYTPRQVDYWTHTNASKTNKEVAALRAGNTAILNAVQAAADNGTPVDLDAVQAAAQQGVSDALASLEADVTLNVDKS